MKNPVGKGVGPDEHRGLAKMCIPLGGEVAIGIEKRTSMKKKKGEPPAAKGGRRGTAGVRGAPGTPRQGHSGGRLA